QGPADLEVGDTAGLETCATRQAPKATMIPNSHWFSLLRLARCRLSLGFCCCLFAAWTIKARAQNQPPTEKQAQAGKAEPADYDTALAAARAAFGRGDFDEAVKQASEALRARPEDETAKGLL